MKRLLLVLVVSIALLPSSIGAATLTGTPPVVVLYGYRVGNTQPPTAVRIANEMANRDFPALWGRVSNNMLRPQVVGIYGPFVVPADAQCGDGYYDTDSTYSRLIEQMALAAGVAFPSGHITVVVNDCGHLEKLYDSSLTTGAFTKGIQTDGKLFNMEFGALLGLMILPPALNVPKQYDYNNFDVFTPMGASDSAGGITSRESLQITGGITSAQVKTTALVTAPISTFVEALEPPTGGLKRWNLPSGYNVEVHKRGGTAIPVIHNGFSLLDLDWNTACYQYALPPGQIFKMGTLGIRNDGVSADGNGVTLTVFPYSGVSTVTCVGGPGSYPVDKSTSTTTTTCTKNCTSTTPTASFAFSPSAPLVNQTVTFDGSTSVAGSGHTLTSFDWTFGDGATATGVTTTHAYASAATFTATLTVRDEANQSASTSRSVTVSTSAPPPPSGDNSYQLTADDLIAILTKSDNGGTLSGLHNLYHIVTPTQNAFYFGGLNFEHFLRPRDQGALNEKDTSSCFYTPRKPPQTLEKLDDRTVRLSKRAADDPCFPVDWSITYHIEGHSVRMSIHLHVVDATPFYGLMGTFFASYMQTMAELYFRFRGVTGPSQPVQWIVDPGTPMNGFTSGGIFMHRDASQLTYPPMNASMHFDAYDYPRFTVPMYCAQSKNGMMYGIAFNKSYSAAEEVRLVAFRWQVKDVNDPNQWKPALDWEWWVRNPQSGGDYDLEALMFWMPSQNVDDCLAQYLNWVP